MKTTTMEHQKPNGQWVDCFDAVGRCKLPQRQKQASNKKSTVLSTATSKPTAKKVGALQLHKFKKNIKTSTEPSLSTAKCEEIAAVLNSDKKVDEVLRQKVTTINKNEKQRIISGERAYNSKYAMFLEDESNKWLMYDLALKCDITWEANDIKALNRFGYIVDEVDLFRGLY